MTVSNNHTTQPQREQTNQITQNKVRQDELDELDTYKQQTTTSRSTGRTQRTALTGSDVFVDRTRRAWSRAGMLRCCRPPPRATARARGSIRAAEWPAKFKLTATTAKKEEQTKKANRKDYVDNALKGEQNEQQSHTDKHKITATNSPDSTDR